MLPYGVEGFATPKHLVKADGSQAQLDEKLPFKVIEFNKDARRIIVSHSRTFEDDKRDDKGEGESPKKAKRAKKEEPIVTPTIEKTTLGDLDALAALKSQMDAEAAAEKKAKKAPAKKAEPKAETKKAEEAKAEEQPKAEAPKAEEATETEEKA